MAPHLKRIGLGWATACERRAGRWRERNDLPQSAVQQITADTSHPTHEDTLSRSGVANRIRLIFRMIRAQTMDSRIVDAILNRIDHGIERIRSEEIAEEIFGAHYAASDHQAAARLEEIQDLLNNTDWTEIPGGNGARWFWERAIEQYRVRRPNIERVAVLRAMKRVAASRSDFEYRGGVLELSHQPNRMSAPSRAESHRERRRIESMLRKMEAIICGNL